MIRVFLRFFSDLLKGDPVALIAAGVIAVIALAICLVWWKIARDLRREDEQRKRRYKGDKRS